MVMVFVAPGNTGNTMLEPSNAYNVVSVVASDSEDNASLWPGNSHGPDITDGGGVRFCTWYECSSASRWY